MLVVQDGGETNAPSAIVTHVFSLEFRCRHVVAKGDEGRVAFFGVPEFQTCADAGVSTIGKFIFGFC